MAALRFLQITEHVAASGRFIKNKLCNFPLASAIISVLSTDFKSRFLTQHCPVNRELKQRGRQKYNRLR